MDTHTRWAVVDLALGEHTAQAAAVFLDLAITRLAQAGITTRGILTDRGPEFGGSDFGNHAAQLGVRHTKTPPRSPNHNAVCERFHSTVHHEFFPVAFHREFFTSVQRLDRQLQTWVHYYNTRRRNRSDYMRGRSPLQLLTAARNRVS